MDLEPSNQKSWCPWIWSQATKSLGVHRFGAERRKVLVSIDLEPSNQKSWCPWIWNQATESLGVHGFGTKQTNSLGVHRFGAELPKRLGVHRFGADQSKVLVSMDLEPSNQKTWCPCIWHQAFFLNYIESAEL